MDWKSVLLFGGMWGAGMLVYSLFGLQIAIMGRCGRRLYYALYKERDNWDAEACRKYMGNVRRINWIIIIAVTVLIYFFAGNGYKGFCCGLLFGWLISGGKTCCNAANVGDACKVFLRFAKFGKEDYIKSRMEEILQKPEALESVPRPDDMPKSNWWKILLVAIAGAAALYGAWYFGVQYGAAAKPEAVTAQIEEAVQNAKNEAKQEQRAKDLKELVHNRSSASIAYSVKKVYGLNPEEAYEIVEAYNENGNHGGYSWDEYQNALGAVLYTANLFAEK